ncbi:NAD(P)-dependent dehydrogenase, short-chain alcohol dehydrogenase family [Catalinimonas alkaloidigena]|uniref:NAD(P)-dependent dehydrogenase, short-chain alcohol dehydrogenase family n=1 Tax=Catalinimonas alkaloidigena TaxID=1075417 RepID=A0A1G9GSW2_9BACT|nr:SDR family oxidoreductase [Catalinimonas alkaloidigena]SDL03702.1 NAD(P)-dependent dehydrogenase, short-chain alcohol dehydrogenase family [Catalinimonas alkaloidigena]
MEGKVCVVTGANTGIGYETAKALAAKGASVILVCRTTEKGQRTVDRIREATGSTKVTAVAADLAVQDQIRKAAAAIRVQHPRIDVLVNNAGIWLSDLRLTKEGVETQFAVNHLAYFLLTHELLPALSRSDDGRIVCVSSDSHFQTHIHFDDLNLTHRYHGLRAYAQSKRANVLFVRELNRRLRARGMNQLTINAVQPGLVKTDIGVKHTISLHSLAWKVRRAGGVTPAEGARTNIFLASSPVVQGVSGQYWDKCVPKRSARETYDPETARRLWDICEKLTDITDYFEGVTPTDEAPSADATAPAPANTPS